MQTEEEKKPVLLFIEDDDHTREKWAKEFAQNNFRLFRVITTANIREAAGIMKKEKIDVVVTDLMWGGPLGEYFESFLRICVDMEIATILMTGARQYERPDMPGVWIVEKPADPEMVYFEICRARLEITERKVERCKEMKIVIIDDEEENRKMMVEDVFGCRGFKNVTACRGIDEASEEMKKGPPDILITDIVGFSGRQNFECLITRCLGIGIKVIFFTGAYWEDIPKIEGVRILIKPVGNREIFDAIDEARKELEGAKANTAPEDQRLKLVYIEDFEPHKKKAVAKLRQHGFDIVAAYSNISEALGVIARKEVDVIVTDICGIGSEGRALEDFLYRCAKKNIAVIVYTGADWINVPNVRGVKRVMKPEFDKIYDAIDKARTELGDATTKRRMTKETREAIHRLANPEWHISTPTVKWLERIFENPDSTAVEKAIAMTSLETDVLRRELKEGTENGNWPRRKMDEYFDRYRELTGKLRALRRKAETNPHCGRIKTVLKC